MSKPQPKANPWVVRTDDSEVPPGQQPAAAPVHAGRRRPAAPPQGLVEPMPGMGLPVWEPDAADGVPPWWWVPCHGGAGATTLATVLGGGDAGRRGWPRYRAAQPGVILVARTHAAGLQAAQRASRQWASGAVGSVRLVGLVAVADTPGRLPRSLRQWLKLVTGGFPRTWVVPWHEPWRRGERPTRENAPRQVVRMGDQLASIVGRAQR